MAKQKVLIAVKTYPSISSKYEELVCTAGFTEHGDWIRLYPIPYRKLDYASQYEKYRWIEIDIEKNTSDFRPESYKPVNINNLIILHSKIGTENNWAERKKTVLKKVYTDLELLINEAKNKEIMTSLAVFKPTKIIDFTIEKVDREWSKEKLAALHQFNLFETSKSKLEIVRKLPYKFSYKFVDINGKESTLMNEDWELGALYWRQLEKYGGDEKRAYEDVKKKYLDFAENKDLYLFLGTTKLNHFTGRNPFIIIGTFYPKKELQQENKLF